MDQAIFCLFFYEFLAILLLILSILQRVIFQHLTTEGLQQ